MIVNSLMFSLIYGNSLMCQLQEIYSEGKVTDMYTPRIVYIHTPGIIILCTCTKINFQQEHYLGTIPIMFPN